MATIARMAMHGQNDDFESDFQPVAEVKDEMVIISVVTFDKVRPAQG